MTVLGHVLNSRAKKSCDKLGPPWIGQQGVQRHQREIRARSFGGPNAENLTSALWRQRVRRSDAGGVKTPEKNQSWDVTVRLLLGIFNSAKEHLHVFRYEDG